MGGAVSYRAGLAAEEAVARRYAGEGASLAARRWRGRSGEIDLVVRDRDGNTVFIEVKQSRSHAEAALHLGERQMRRIWSAASEFLAGEPLGQATPSRFDVALVDGQGLIEVIENAFAA